MTDYPADGGTEDDAANDPFHPNNIDKVALIVQLRIYDALMGILAAADKDTDVAELHQLIIETHNNGKILGPLPWIDLSDPDE